MEGSSKDKEKREFVIYIGLLIVAAILGMNTNHHPMSWINRILPVIEINRITIYWGGIILIILIYNVFRKLYLLKGWRIFNKDGKCFVWTLIFIILINAINPKVVQTIKMLESGLDAIYLDREALMDFKIHNTSEDGTMSYKTEGHIMLINCSNQKVGPFKVKVILSKREDYPKGEFESVEDYYLEPKEQRYIKLDLEGVSDESKSDGSKMVYILRKNFEIVLWNDKEQVRFLSE